MRHEVVLHDKSLEKQSVKDRYKGEEDPVADKMLKSFETLTHLVNKTLEKRVLLTAPKDKSVTTLYITGLHSEINDSDIRYIFLTHPVEPSFILLEKSNRSTFFREFVVPLSNLLIVLLLNWQWRTL